MTVVYKYTYEGEKNTNTKKSTLAGIKKKKRIK
jgi:hypothetical protein